jgi:Holliday junction resolvasome RuvABC endonuclease subunit
MSRTISILGIDPSMNNFGYAAAKFDLDTQELTYNNIILNTPVKPPKKKTVRQNSVDLELARNHFQALTKYVSRFDIVCVEIPVGSQTARAMASYGICVGLLASISKPLIQVTPTEVKIAATGNKTASKRDMINWACSQNSQLNWLTRSANGDNILIDKNEHMADAMAAIKAGVATDEFKTILLSK